MADVRAEILAASRSRTGWLEGSVQAPESQPFVSKVKSNFEEKSINQDNKLSSNASKSEACRRLGSKVSSIATLFQSFSPHRSESPKSCEAVPRIGPQKTDLHPQNDSESLHKRISNARAIFEQLGEKGKECSKNILEERDRIPSVSSQLSPDDEAHNGTFFLKSPTQMNEKSHMEKLQPDSLQNMVKCQNFVPPDSTKKCSQNSPIYEEIPSIIGKKSTGSSQTPISLGHYETITKTEGDKNANTTNSFNEPLVHSNDKSMDPSFPIYAQVIKKRVKHSAIISNPQQKTNAESSKSSPDALNGENLDYKSSGLNNSWKVSTSTDSNTWRQNTSVDQSSTEAEGLYAVSSDLRDAAGETLAEYEVRDHELFFVETVLRSKCPGNLINRQLKSFENS